MLLDVLFWGIIITLVVVLCAVWCLALMDYRKMERHNEENKRYWVRRDIELTDNKRTRVQARRARFKGVNHETRRPR